MDTAIKNIENTNPVPSLKNRLKKRKTYNTKNNTTFSIVFL